MYKFRATDSKINAHITLPPPLQVEKEALINLRISKFNKIAEHFHHNDTRNGLTEMNLPEDTLMGYDSIKKRMRKKEIIMLQTDKSGKLVQTNYPSFVKGQIATPGDCKSHTWGAMGLLP